MCYLIAQIHDVAQVLLGDLGAHGDLGGLLDLLLDVLGQDVVELGGHGVGLVADLLDRLAVGDVVLDELGELGKVPAVPLLAAHDVVVQLLVQVVQQGYCLHDHRVDFVGTELELVARQAFRIIENIKKYI